jgi:hypothetical protein
LSLRGLEPGLQSSFVKGSSRDDQGQKQNHRENLKSRRRWQLYKLVRSSQMFQSSDSSLLEISLTPVAGQNICSDRSNRICSPGSRGKTMARPLKVAIFDVPRRKPNLNCLSERGLEQWFLPCQSNLHYDFRVQTC